LEFRHKEQISLQARSYDVRLEEAREILARAALERAHSAVLKLLYSSGIQHFLFAFSQI
jgi:hypothetical protein